MSSTMILNPKQRRKIDDATSASSSTVFNTDRFRWSTSIAQQTYSAKLIDGLRRVRRRTTFAPVSYGGLAVRQAADTVLATAAKGRTQWSRAILTSRLKWRLKNRKTAKRKSKVRPPRPRTADIKAEETEARVEKRVKVLGRLVPGCRKLSFRNLLEETSDYIYALEMQVGAMAAVAELLSGTSATSAEVDSSNVSGDDDNPVH